MLIYMLIDNERKDSVLCREHGLSILIDFQGKKLLFDTGASGAFMKNASEMGLDIGEVDTVIISHAHSDHCGGLPAFLGTNKQAPVFISSKVTREYYFKQFFIKENISVPAVIFNNYVDRMRFVEGFTRIDDNIFVVSGFKHPYPLVKSSRSLLVEKEGLLEQDEFDHELALVINNGGKLVVITGCSHNGADNMLETVKGYFPGVPIQVLIGGFHLMGFPFSNIMGESRKNIETLGKRFIDNRVEKTYTCHCTGIRGFNILKKVMGEKISYLSTGMQVEL